MPVCSFCKKNYHEHKGVTVFAFDGKTHHFCSSKCRNNLALKRDPKKVNWVKREKKVKQDNVTNKVVEKNLESKDVKSSESKDSESGSEDSKNKK
ncbi:hypothetical protein HOD75_03985 [archaeon]|jgi:large subunit ribosomal protein L24e|nr:hypothetical protein [archaeon]MBT4242029.1 hypothetical protein [archaeon]MBT4418576.1 hypothetical protein [archaeon]